MRACAGRSASGRVWKIEQKRHVGDTERVVAAHFHRLIARFTVADIDEARADVHAMIRIADALKQPAQLWQARALEATLALATGRFAEGEELARQARTLGERAVAQVAIPVYWLQRYSLCESHGYRDELEQAIRELVANYPARPVFRCVLAHLYARLGRTRDARREFDELARAGFRALPFDLEWLYGMSLLAETCAAIDDSHSAVVLHKLLRPYAAFVASDVPEGFGGAVSRYLGILATTTKRWQQAEQHFDNALDINARMAHAPGTPTPSTTMRACC